MAKAPESAHGGPRLDSPPVTHAAPRRLLTIVAALIVSSSVSTATLAHASLVSSTPADGATVPITDATAVTLTFDDDLDPGKSKFELVDAGGAIVATGAVGSDPRVMSASGLALARGAYQVRWTAVASDGDLTRGIVSFQTIQEGAVSIGPSTASAATPSPAASAGTAPVAGGSPGDVLLPIIAAAVIVAVVAAKVLRRGRAA